MDNNEEQMQMLLMVLKSLKCGICLFQSQEQSKWVALIKEKLGSGKVITHNIADDDEKDGMPASAEFRKWASESEANVVIVYNMQLLGLRFGDKETIERLNYMRDQIQHIGKLFLFGVSPYFRILLSRNARDLYSCIRYFFNFDSDGDSTKKMITEDALDYYGEDALEIQRYQEYKKRIQKEEPVGKIQVYLDCMESWVKTRGLMPYEEKSFVLEIAGKTDTEYRKKKISVSEMENIWILARTWLELEAFPESFYWYRFALGRIKEELGENHEMYADALIKINYFYEQRGDYEACEKNCDQAIQIYESKKADYSGRYGDAKIERAILYRRKSQYEEALAIYEDILQFNSKKYGSQYYENAYCLNNIGCVYEEMQDETNALKKYQEALELLVVSKKKNFLLIAIYENISSIYLKSDDTKNAWKYIQMAKETAESIYGTESDKLTNIYSLMDEIRKRERK